MEQLASDTSSFEGGPPFSAEPHGWGISMSVSGEFQRARSLWHWTCRTATGYRSKTASVLEAVATTAPEAADTTPSVKAIREPALTTVPVAVSNPLPSRTAVR